MDYREYIKKLGYKKNPYATFNAEQEDSFISKTIYRTATHESLVNAFENGSSVIIAGDRGIGKSALIKDILKAAGNKAVPVEIYNYQNLQNPYTQNDLASFILKNITISIFSFIARELNNKINIPQDDKIFLSSLYKEFIGANSEEWLKQKIRDIQTSKLRKAYQKTTNTLLAPLNYFANAGLKGVIEFSRQYFPWMNSEDLKYQEYFKEISTGSYDDISFSPRFIETFERIADICQLLGARKLIIIFDKIDEDPRFESDIKEIANFIKPILANTAFLSNNKYQVVFSTWKIPYILVREIAREQKFQKPILTWDSDDLLSAWEKRHTHFRKFNPIALASKKKWTHELFSEDVKNEDIQEILKISNRNPRDLWHVINAIIKEQKKLQKAIKISKSSINNGLDKFATEFNYYEYYPKVIGEAKSRRDIFSYISYLCQLKSETFTTTNIREDAKAGGRTSYLIQEMINIGLIRKIDSADARKNTYEIIDPKVVHCIKRRITPNRHISGDSQSTLTELSADLEISATT